MRRFLLGLTILLISSNASSVDTPVKFGGFIDSYYAWDANQPKQLERDFTTQPVRHNEFNINLAYIEAVVTQERTRGRLALQYGNSVTKNYSGERNTGSTSGPQDVKFLQEAFVGTKIGEKTWIDMGIFLGNIGSESWISKDNWTYSRSLNLDYVPYYSSGVRLEHQLSSSETFQFQLLNGWQNVSETNSGKAIGMQYKNVLNASNTFTYNNFFGDEEVVSDTKTGSFNPRFRAYHNFIWYHVMSDQWAFIGAMDVGHQAQQANKGTDGWFASTATFRRILNETDAVAFRMEYYNDRHQSNVVTNTDNGFQITGASVNFDKKLDRNALWRTEIRSLQSHDRIFPNKNDEKKYNDTFLVTSLSLWF